MIKSRIELHNTLKQLLGADNVYYQPPENLKIKYPAIIYTKKDIEKYNANDRPYFMSVDYTITVISSMPDNPVINKILNLEGSEYERYYYINSLNHDVINMSTLNT